MRKFRSTVLWTLFFVIAPLAAMAVEAATSGGSSWGYALGAGLGCGIGQGLTAGIARNPGAAGAMFVNFFLGMVLIESIAIYGLVIAFMLQGKI